MILHKTHKTDYDIFINRRNTMQNFIHIHKIQIINLQLITTTQTPIFTLPDSQFDIYNISNPQNPQLYFSYNCLFNDIKHTLKCLNLYYKDIKANKCPICINNNIKKAFNII